MPSDDRITPACLMPGCPSPHATCWACHHKPPATLTVMPADTLGRYLVGDIISHTDMMTDPSPWVRFWLPNNHGTRIQTMLRQRRHA